MPSVIAAYENRIRKPEAEKIAHHGRPLKSLDDALGTAMDFLENPMKLSERLEDKRTVLKLAFADRLVYTRKEGFRTPNPSLPSRF